MFIIWRLVNSCRCVIIVSMNEIVQTRKQREFDARNDLILDIARKHLLDVGYAGLNMERIASEAEYSRGTIYLHFRNKDDILMGLAAQTMRSRHDMFERAANYNAISRVKMQCVGIADMLFVNLFPEHFKVEQIIRSTSIRERTSPERRNSLDECEGNCMKTVSSIIQLGIDEGNLVLPSGRTAQDIGYGLWSMALGSHLISTSGTQLKQLGVSDPQQATSHNFKMLLDGHNWRPLSNEYDYDASEGEIFSTLFAEEWNQILSKTT